MKWFGHDKPRGFTSRHSHWRSLPKENLPRTDRILGPLFDMRLPLSFSRKNCEALRDILCNVLRGMTGKQAG